MDPDRYCVDQAAPPGSSLHYATLFAAARYRAVVVAVHAFRHVLLAIVDTIAEPEVRARKLNWWSDEVMEARDGRARHPVAIAITHHCGTRFWRRPEVVTVLSAVAGASAASGPPSEAARDRFCADVGGGTARLCATAVAGQLGEVVPAGIGGLGTALEGAVLAGAPIARSGQQRIPDPAPGARNRSTGDHRDGRALRIAEERIRASTVLSAALREAQRESGPVMLVYRTLADIQLAALTSALRKPAGVAPSVASIAPIRKLWIAWRTARRHR